MVAADFSVVASAPAVAALGAALTHFRFFHAVGERLPLEARRYASRFDTRSARWIKTEFGLVYPAVPAATSFSVECAYAFPDGTIRPVKMERRIPAGWTGSVHAQGIGWGSSGNWPVGTYRVSCRSEGREFGAGSFELIDNTAPPAVQGALLAVFGRKGPIGGAPDTRFVLGQFDSLFAEATFPSRIAGDSTLLHCTAFDPLGEAAGFEIPTAVKNRTITGTGRIPLDPPLARGLYSVECRINNRSVGVERFEMTGAPEVKALDARLLGSALYEGGDQSPDDEAVSDESFSATRVRSFWLMMLFDHPSDAGAGPLGYGCKVIGARNVVIGDSGPQTATIAPGERAIVLITRLALLPRQRWTPGRYTVACTGGAGSLLSTRFELTR